MNFVDPRRTPFVKMKSRGELPHLYKPAGTYFVTFRLLDAVVPPQRTMSEDDSDELRLAKAYEPPITLGSCVLARPEIASVVADALVAGKDLKYELYAWCVMPNHAHAVFAPFDSHRFDQIMQSWKGGTARRINQLVGRTGPLWERESFDHLIRSVAALSRFASYVEENPVTAGLCYTAEDWQFGSRYAASCKALEQA
ncbi:transposase [Humisphaera borealis]|uniref:Transposase n=1 Tax=Humisphaera borealis TaxID=2807512 RepID=A0A7M2WRN0_9BACT|nr:transposase [Humisphaera borealis]QOV88049.1 transposase [Humisphaera borealis]